MRNIDLAGIGGLRDYWASRTFQPGAVPSRTIQWRTMLDALGLWIEQTATYLREQPDFATFLAWITATAGQPDGAKLDRYQAWLQGGPIPPATQALIDVIDAMPDVLDAEQLGRWNADGVVVLRNAISRTEAMSAEKLLWREIGAEPDDPTTWYDRRTQGIMFQFFQHPALEAARRSRRIHKAFAQLYGTADLWTTTDRMSFNPPETAGHAFPGPHLHWDTSLTLPIPLSISGILYLTDTAADQGALQVVPGFHRRIAPWLATLGDADPRRVDLSAEAVTVPADAGDLVIWRSEIAHGASANRNVRPRMAQYVAMYRPDWVEQSAWR